MLRNTVFQNKNIKIINLAKILITLKGILSLSIKVYGVVFEITISLTS